MNLLGLRYAMRERTRFLLTAAGVASAVLLTTFLVGVYRGATRGSLSYIEGSGADVWVGRRGTWNLLRASGLLPTSAGPMLESVRGVRSASPILGALLPARLEAGRRTLLVIGLPPLGTVGRPRNMASGTPDPARGEIVLDAAFARRAHLRVGDHVDLAERRFRVAGLSRDTNLLVTQYAFVRLADLESLLGIRDRATFFLLRVDPGQAGAVARRLAQRSPLLATFDRETFLENNRQEIAAGFLPVLWAVALIGLLVGATVVALMAYAAVLEKRGDLALLGALGGSLGAPFSVVMQQSLAAALAGALAGLAALFGVARVLPALVPEVELSIGPAVAIASIAGALCVSGLGALIPAALATAVPPMEAFRR